MIDIADVVGQALKELDKEEFRAAVEAKKVTLRALRARPCYLMRLVRALARAFKEAR